MKRPGAPPQAGYSETPLPRKLGIKPNSVLAVLGAPADFGHGLGTLPEAVTIRKQARGACNVIVLFAKTLATLERRFPPAIKALAEGGGLWVAWPKKASGVATELSDGIVREFGLATVLVDNKVCAIDATWSGLRFMRRRPQHNR